MNPVVGVDRGRSLAEVRSRVQCEQIGDVRAVEGEDAITHLREAVEPPISRLSMTVAETLSVRVNGEPRRIAAGATIAGMIAELGLDPLRLAVERNLAIVPRSSLDSVRVEDGDQYEIVHFVGGG